MFDDFVEHAGSPSAGAAAGLLAQQTLASAPVQYEGFEPSPYEVGGPQLELLPQGPHPSSQEGIFDLGHVQFSLPAPLVCMAVSSDVLVFGLSSNLILILELARAENVIRVPIPRKASEFSFYKLFLDPSGRHIIATSVQGENWYLYRGWTKPRQLKSFKFVLESVAWNTRALLSSGGTSTREILLGARNGTVYEAVVDAEDDMFRGQERHLHPVFALPERQPVTGLSFTFFPTAAPTKALVVVTTPSRIYQFVGAPGRPADDNGRLFAGLFAAYKDKHLQITEMPGDISHSELNIFTPTADQATILPAALAWLTAAGLYHGALNFDSTTDDLIAGASLFAYPIGIPVATLITEFHLVFLYRDRVIALNTMDHQAVYAYEEIIPLKPNEEVRGLAADPIRKTYWVYTDQTIFELRKDNEDRDIWKTYMAKGKYDFALKYAKTAAQRDVVLSAQADAFFADGKFFPAANAYAACSMPFEEVTLKFLDAEERDALRAYLVARLERTKRTDVTQRAMLATWLVEFYLSKCDELDDLVAAESVTQDVDNLRTERTIVEDDLRQFFETYKTNLDRTTTYELIQAHGRTDMFLHFATVVGDLDRVVEHHVLEEEWLKAIDVISRQADLALYYQFAPVLLRNAPGPTVEAWLRQSALDPVRLVPALLQVQHTPTSVAATATSPTDADPAVRFLTHAIFERKSTETALHTLLLTLHASHPDESRLLRFLSSAPDDPSTNSPCFDLDYALRLCASSGRTGACAVIYARMGMWAEAVDLALRVGDVALAKIHADKPASEEERKRLWLRVARHVVEEKQDIKAAMRTLADTDLLQIEDVLPFFPDFVLIDDFKDEICAALEAHAAKLQELRASLDEAAETAASVRVDVEKLQNRFVTIDASERCAVCSRGVFTKQFFVFPCMHVMHADCLIGLAKEYLPQHALRKLLALQETLIQAQGTAVTTPGVPSAPGQPPRRQPSNPARTLLSSNLGNLGNLSNLNPLALQPASLGRGLRTAGDKLRDLVVPDALAALVAHPLIGVGIGGGRQVDGKAEENVEKARKELEELLAGSCPLCESVVVGLDRGFIAEGEDDESWAV